MKKLQVDNLKTKSKKKKRKQQMFFFFSKILFFKIKTKPFRFQNKKSGKSSAINQAFESGEAQWLTVKHFSFVCN